MQAARRERACPNASAGADVDGIEAGRMASHITQDRGRDLRRVARSEPRVVASQPRKISVFHIDQRSSCRRLSAGERLLEQELPLSDHALVQRHVLWIVDFTPLTIGAERADGKLPSG